MKHEKVVKACLNDTLHTPWRVENLLFEEKYLSCNGLRLHYRDWGNKQPKTLVALHGIHGNARVWDGFAESQQERRRVLTLDMRGHGDSEWSRDASYEPEDFLADLSHFVDGIELQSFALMGLSLGGIVAFAFAAMNPGRVERLVVVDIGPDLGSEGMQQIRDSADSRPASFATFDEAITWATGGDESLDTEDLRRRMHLNLALTPEGRLQWKFDPATDSLIAPGSGRDTSIMWALWSSISCPTLIVRGENSPLLTSETARRMESSAPNATLVEIANAGHIVMDDNPIAFNEAVSGFLAQ